MTKLHAKYEAVLEVVLRDPRSFYMMERIQGVGGHASAFNQTVRIETMVHQSLSMLGLTGAEVVASNSNPHGIDWFFARVAEAIGLDVWFLAIAPLPNRVWVVKGTDLQELVPVNAGRDDPDGVVREEVKEYVARLSSTYDKAIPREEVAVRSKRGGRNFSWLEAAKEVLMAGRASSIGRRFMVMYRKLRALRTYRRLAIRQVAEPYIVYFLHFQPERNTLPEGLEFSQQWLAIRRLQSSLPTGWRLVVKEHPCTFQCEFHPGVRDPHLYQSIAGLPNTELVDLDVSPFELVDRAKAVATINGTVGLESVVRGIPVLVFGLAQYRKCPGVRSVASQADILRAITDIVEGRLVATPGQAEDYFNWVFSASHNAPVHEMNFWSKFGLVLDALENVVLSETGRQGSRGEGGSIVLRGA